MVVVTILEWLPVLRVNEASWVYLMIFPLIACNAYQILMLPKYNKLSAEERERKSSAKNITKTQLKKQTPKASR